MAIITRTLEEILKRPPQFNMDIINATTEEDIIRHMFEDGEISENEMNAMILLERQIPQRKAA
jgi:uncharacterized membrane protein